MDRQTGRQTGRHSKLHTERDACRWLNHRLRNIEKKLKQQKKFYSTRLIAFNVNVKMI